VERIDSTATSRLQSRADTLADEISSEQRYLEIDATLDPVELSGGVSLGDAFTLTLPQYDINRELRVIETVRSIDEAGELVDVTLSNRSRTLAGRDGPLAI
jgi:hypothetical protein